MSKDVRVQALELAVHHCMSNDSRPVVEVAREFETYLSGSTEDPKVIRNYGVDPDKQAQHKVEHVPFELAEAARLKAVRHDDEGVYKIVEYAESALKRIRMLTEPLNYDKTPRSISAEDVYNVQVIAYEALRAMTAIAYPFRPKDSIKPQADSLTGL